MVVFVMIYKRFLYGSKVYRAAFAQWRLKEDNARTKFLTDLPRVLRISLLVVTNEFTQLFGVSL